MATEVELKLSLPEFAVPVFISIANQADQPMGVGQGEPLILDNQYYDTDDLALNKSHAALRIRKSQHGFKQTLKNKGKAIAGLHQRGEWEYDIHQPEINWSLFPEELNIDPKLKQAIKPIFKTDFTRHVWIKHYKNSEIELVLDLGSIHNKTKSYSLCEVELELLSGQAEDLFAFAQELAALVPLVPCDINKAERGYGLTSNISFYQAIDFSHQFKSALDINVFLQDGLTRIARHWDQFSQSKDWWKILVLSRDVQAIEYVLSNIGTFSWPEKESSNAYQKVTEVLASWKKLKHELIELLIPARVVIALFVDDHSNSRGLSQRLLKTLTHNLNDKIQHWINTNTFGQSLLLLGDYLYKYGESLNTQATLSDHIWQDLDALASRASDMPVQQFEDLQSIQTLAYLYKRFDQPAYLACNQLIKQHLVVLGMHDALALSVVTDEDSRAKLASWCRRLTVEQRRLQNAREQLFDVM